MNTSTASIEIITAVFAPGEQRTFALSGQYFELIDAPGPVDVVLSDVYGAQRGLMRSAEASFNLKNTNFGVIQITSATAQTIRFAYGSGEAGTRRAAGSVNIANVPTVALQAADMALVRRPELSTNSWADNTANVANTPKTIFTPAANVNGAIVLSASFSENLASGFFHSLLAKVSAPASASDGELLMTVSPQGSTGSVLLTCTHLPYAMRVAAGLGLYYFPNTASNGVRGARYILL